MHNEHLYKWSVKSGDYHRQNGDYDKLYHKGKKREKMMRFLMWTGAALVTWMLFLKVLAYAASK